MVCVCGGILQSYQELDSGKAWEVAASTLEEQYSRIMQAWKWGYHYQQCSSLRTNLISEESGDVEVEGDLHRCFQLPPRRQAREAFQI